MTGTARRGAVLALLCDRDAVARLGAVVKRGIPGVLAAGAPIDVVDRLGAAHAALAARRYALLVIEPRDADGTPTDEAIRALRDAHPGMAILGYVKARAGMSVGLLAFARAGVHELVVGGVDDFEGAVHGALRASLATAVRRADGDALLDAVAEVVPPALHPLVRYCFEHAVEARTVPEIARALGVSRQALALRTRAAGLPAPRELATWCRLLLAAQLIAECAYTVDQAALELDFASSNGLRNAMQRYAGLSLAAVRDGGTAPVLDAFRSAVRAAQHRDAALPIG